MEIAPIPGIRALPAVKAASARTPLLAVFDLEGPGSAREDSDGSNARKSPGGQDDAVDDLAAEAGDEDKPGTQVNFFA